MHTSTIDINQVSFSFDETRILNNISLTLVKGRSYALIGKSGTGKSTLLNLLAGFLKPDTGEIRINGQALDGPRQDTAFLFQDLGLFHWQTITQAVAMPLKIKGQKHGIEEEVLSLLKELKLENHLDKYPTSLSGGEKQRVALARTLIGRPNLLLMDEPSSALDAMTKEGFQNLLLQWQQKHQATLLFVTHDIEEAVMLGSDILLLNEEGAISQLENPYYMVEKPREQLGFYDACIRIRKMLHMEKLYE